MRPVYKPGVSRNLISTNVPNPLTRFWFNQLPYPHFSKQSQTFNQFGFQNRFPTGGDSKILRPTSSAISKIFYHFFFKIKIIKKIQYKMQNYIGT